MDATISLTVDGRQHHLTVDTRTTVLDALREHLDVTNPKKGCDHGQCGACTVLVEHPGEHGGRRRVLSCLSLAVAHDGAEITTAGGLAPDGELHPIAESFLANDAYQCGYCTPGQVCSAVGVLDEIAAGHPSAVTGDLTGPVTADRAEIAERLSGNLCRCAAYGNIVSAVEAVAPVKPFAYLRPTDATSAVATVAADPDATFLGGGTNLLDHLKLGIAGPTTLVDVTRLTSHAITGLDDGGLRIGAGVRNSDLAAHPRVRSEFPALAHAVLSGASGQLRNMATTGGNLLQRTRCAYFADPASPCTKRSADEACSARTGWARHHAILGADDTSCVATHPSDMAVALLMLDARVRLLGPDGERTIALAELYRSPGDDPTRDTVLDHGELVTAVDVPAAPIAARSAYRKVRDRASFAFALVSVAAALDVADGVVRDVRIALGGVAHRPWRASVAERALRGRPAVDEEFRAAAAAELAAASAVDGAVEGNAFKIPLVAATVTSTLRQLAASGQEAA